RFDVSIQWMINGGVLAALVLVLLAAPQNAPASIIIKVGSDITVEEGTTVDHVVSIGGQITINGHVEHHAVAVGSSVVLGSSAVVRGNVLSLGGIVVRGRGAEVFGDITEINSSQLSQLIESILDSDWEGWNWIYAVLSIVFFILFLILVLLIAAFIPNHIYTIATAIREESLKVIIWGILGLILIAPLAVLLTISVVGIVLIPLELLLVLCAVLAGLTAISHLTGKSLFYFMNKSRQGIIAESFWGLVILWLIGWIPYIGVMIKAFAIVLALGAVLVTRFGTRQKATTP
ncbi:MAG TPA: hypothetical protein PK470_04625, partial [Candidatus Omnitrophota bacterium]|nr:hypothetical protein [Candidatus Omnitrophota bacterium]